MEKLNTDILIQIKKLKEENLSEEEKKKIEEKME